MRNEKQKNEEIKKSARTILFINACDYNNKSKEKEEKREKNKKDN